MNNYVCIHMKRPRQGDQQARGLARQMDFIDIYLFIHLHNVALDGTIC